MKRYTSNFILTNSPEKKLRRHFIELNDQGQVTDVRSLDEEIYEPAGTVFVDGVITPALFSPSLRGLKIPANVLVLMYDSSDCAQTGVALDAVAQATIAPGGKEPPGQYMDLPGIIENNAVDVILDLGTEDPAEFTKRFLQMLHSEIHLTTKPQDKFAGESETQPKDRPCEDLSIPNPKGPILAHVNIWKLISAATVLPRLLSGQRYNLEKNCLLEAVVWQGIGYAESRLSSQFKVMGLH